MVWKWLYFQIGFSKGYISIVSSHMSEVKQEINSKQLFKKDLNELSVSDEVNRIAVAGENLIMILDKNSLDEIT